jgi:hypothetical protein
MAYRFKVAAGSLVLLQFSQIDLRKVDQLWFLDLITDGLARTA